MTATLATPASNAIVNPEDDGPLSPWWLRAIGIVMVLGFAVLIAITFMAYRNAPPIPHLVADPQGKVLFTDADISDGQAVFLKYGLMDNGSIWGHGAYLGPDYSAAALHWMGQDTAAALAQTQFAKPLAQLDPMQRAGLQAQVALVLKTNRYDPVSGVLTLTSAEAQAWRQQIGYWTDYFKRPDRQRGPEIEPDQRSGRTASVHRVCDLGGMGLRGKSARPESFLYQQFSVRSERRQYTDPRRDSVERIELAGVAGRYRRGPPGIWQVRLSGLDQSRPCDPPLRAARRSQSGSTCAGQVLCPRRTGASVPDPGGWRHRALSRRSGSFYGFQLENIFPSNLMRTWHLQSAIMWIATSYVAAALFLGRHPAPRRAARSCRVDAPAVRRVRPGNRRQSARRMGRHLAAAWPLVVLDR